MSCALISCLKEHEAAACIAAGHAASRCALLLCFLGHAHRGFPDCEVRIEARASADGGMRATFVGQAGEELKNKMSEEVRRQDRLVRGGGGGKPNLNLSPVPLPIS